VVDSDFSTVICAPVYSKYTLLETQVEVGVEEGLKHDSCIVCDELVSFQKPLLTDFVGSLSPEKLNELNNALKVALAIED
jgi:mRNA interferase MazF